MPRVSTRGGEVGAYIFSQKGEKKVDIEKKNLIRKIIGALVNAFFLPGLGQVIVGRVMKGIELIVMAVALFFGGFYLTLSFMKAGFSVFAIGVSLLLFLCLCIVWVYALMDVIKGEVKPLRGEKKEKLAARKFVGILANIIIPGLGQVIVGRVRRGIGLIIIFIAVVFWYLVMTVGLVMLVYAPYHAISFAISYPSPLWMLLGYIIWLYALIDVIRGEVKL
jgi:TM2 domain-containing membrane protein YozV